MDRKNFIGLDGFVWFMGVVENRHDPLRLGRCQVRCFGWHTDNKILIPTADLPWAQPMFPVNGGDLSATLKEGDYVIGFFSDGDWAQFPIIMGTIPGVPNQAPNTGKGFSDQRNEDDLTKSPRTPQNVTFNNSGIGVNVTEKDKAPIYPFKLNEPTTSRLYRNENIANTAVGLKRTSMDKNVPTAFGDFWDEPYPAYNASPPFNHVTETESGHAFEMDDTPGSERIHMLHRTGTFFEMYPSGTKVEKVVKNNYQIILGDDMIHVMGKVNITVDGDTNILSRGDVNIIGGNDLTARIAGVVDITAGENMNFKAANFTFSTPGSIDIIANTIRESSVQKNVTASIYSETSGVKNMTASLYNETVGTSNYRWNSTKSMYIGGDTFTVPASGYTDFGCPSDRGGATACPSVQSASPSAAAIDPNIYEAPFRASKNDPAFSEEEIPIPNLDVVPLEELTPEQAYALHQSAQYGPSTSNTSDPSVVASQANTANIVANADAACIPVAQLTPSINCINTIKKFEGFRANAYVDPATKGPPITIGYGATAAALGRPVNLGDTVTEAQASADLQTMVTKFANSVRKQLTTQCVTQGQFDALCSFAYNAGAGNLAKSSMLRFTNAQDKASAANAFLEWNKAAGKVLPGLTTRREAEKALYLS